MEQLRIVGFDPASTRNLGWAIVDVKVDAKKKCRALECIAGTFVIPQMPEVWQAYWPMELLLNKQ